MRRVNCVQERGRCHMFYGWGHMRHTLVIGSFLPLTGALLRCQYSSEPWQRTAHLNQGYSGAPIGIGTGGGPFLVR